MSKKILIADDDKTLTKILSSFLVEHGYKIIVAHDGEEALMKLEFELPDLILLDVEMPKINGYAFLFDMKKLEQSAQTPVIVLTCKDEMRDLFKVEGVKEYIVKPFVNQDLLKMIQKYI
ncbi:MAG: response regulator [Candidatus Omnitrophica bacterium]|nr:response regulator [Candidatus Omnitrophota bacterium]